MIVGTRQSYPAWDGRYNLDAVSARAFEIRLCLNPACGLRYPLSAGHPFGERCPVCLGETMAVMTRSLPADAGASEPPQSRGPSLLLDNIRSAWNVGSILRSADGAGFTHAFLCGLTPTPENPVVRKTALGAEDSVSWSSHRDGAALAGSLAAKGFRILALETVEGAITLRDSDLGGMDPSGLVLVVGSEAAGIDPGILELASQAVCIPMRGRKRSLNVAVAFGIAAFLISERLVKARSDSP